MNGKSIKINGGIHTLGKRIGKGGEGEVYALASNADLAVKIYTLKDLGERENKIKTMVTLGLAKQTALVAFPIDYVQNEKGEFIGFLMRLVSGHKPLHELYAPGSRKLHFPHADYRFLVRAALNVAKAIASVHKAGAVIGDINHSSLLISPKAVVALIDADSFQVSDKNKKYLCTVGVPEYTPPELQGHRLSSIVRATTHDAFGLAIVVFQLLFMGRHPFVGTIRSGEIPPLHENIKNYRYAYTTTRNVGMDQPPGTPSISEFHQELANTFEKSFGPNSYLGRPSAEEWVKVLENLEKSLIKCDANPLHFFPSEANECPWCEMEHELATLLFLPYQFDTGGNYVQISFDQLEAVWKEAELISIPENLHPIFPSLNLEPSSDANNQKPNTSITFPYLMAGILGIIAILVLNEAYKFLAIPLIIWGFWPKKIETAPSYSRFSNAYEEAAAAFQSEVQNWHSRIGVYAFLKLKNELLETKNSFRIINAEKETLIQNYKKNRYEKQLLAYLDRFAIVDANLKGIGPAKLATLSSYGIDTAADISRSRILNLPGFGEINSKPLIEWRVKKEKSFVYNQTINEGDKTEIAKISYECDKKLLEIKRKITESLLLLKRYKLQIEQACQKEDIKVSAAKTSLEQALVDLKHLGVAPPVFSQIVSTSATIKNQVNTSQKTYSAINATNTTTSNPRPIGYKPSGSTTTPTCHLCGSSMTKRLAKRGRNAGNYFWGCTRYPRCKGTKPI